MSKLCSLDAHKNSIFCTIYNGETYSDTKEYETTTVTIHSMVECLQSEGVTGSSNGKYGHLLDSSLRFAA
jgi:hypothetical protein